MVLVLVQQPTKRNGCSDAAIVYRRQHREEEEEEEEEEGEANVKVILGYPLLLLLVLLVVQRMAKTVRFSCRPSSEHCLCRNTG